MNTLCASERQQVNAGDKRTAFRSSLCRQGGMQDVQRYLQKKRPWTAQDTVWSEVKCGSRSLKVWVMGGRMAYKE
jgi:hypothetical protein